MQEQTKTFKMKNIPDVKKTTFHSLLFLHHFHNLVPQQTFPRFFVRVPFGHNIPAPSEYFVSKL